MPLKPSDDISVWIDDFQKSDDPKFSGKSKEKRREMAIAAHYAAQNEDAYMKGVAKDKKDDRQRAFDRQAKMSDDDPDAYKPAPGDKDKDGELKKTKVSKHTKKYRQMYGENQEPIEEKIAGLEKKAKKSGISYGILKQVYDRGMAAWKTGHRPGASQQQWAFARVNSFITKGSGTWGKADKDLAAKVKKEETEMRNVYRELADKLEEKKKGLWANIHAKRKRGEAPAKPGDKDYPEKLPEEIELDEVSYMNKLLTQNKLSSAEYQRAKKLKGFDKANYTWNSAEQLYINKGKNEEAELDETRSMYLHIKGMRTAAAHAKKDGANLKDKDLMKKYHTYHMKKNIGMTHFTTNSDGSLDFNSIGKGTKIEPKHYKDIFKKKVKNEGIEEAKEKTVRQLINPNKEVMVVKMVGKQHKVVVIDKDKQAEYLKKGWLLAEEEIVSENKMKNLAIQFSDEMNELCKLMKNRKDRVACETIAKLVEKGNMKGAAAAMSNLSKESKEIVVGSFTSLFGDAAAKKYGISEDTSFYAEYISKIISK